jgi:hypothetical protein
MASRAGQVKAACGKPRNRPSFSPMSRQDVEREKRLAEALRENLRRRKAQARGEEEPVEQPTRRDG